ncbi:hypothetical protein CGC20_7605 [Leishmania donovani]|uniref:Uncharacterized protein n=1 Tax=Leishmania donovani TaxID=5661 RepID=A0A504XF33_LEIDO|nr:hypothetical protein CGC20_7605 [Leishmania donovani]
MLTRSRAPKSSTLTLNAKASLEASGHGAPISMHAEPTVPRNFEAVRTVRVVVAAGGVIDASTTAGQAATPSLSPMPRVKSSHERASARDVCCSAEVSGHR